MRQIVLACMVVGFIGGNVSIAAQEPVSAVGADASLIRIETLELEPTVVKTGDVITQTYRVRFPDLISDGREILILEDRINQHTHITVAARISCVRVDSGGFAEQLRQPGARIERRCIGRPRLDASVPRRHVRPLGPLRRQTEIIHAIHRRQITGIGNC